MENSTQQDAKKHRVLHDYLHLKSVSTEHVKEPVH